MTMNPSVIFAILLAITAKVSCFRCDRRPYGSTSPPSVADGRYKLSVTGTKDSYIPDQLYTVKLAATDGVSTYSTFIISAEGDLHVDPQNPRRLLSKYPGLLRPLENTLSRYSERCHNSLEQISSVFKSEVEVYWQAPPSGNGCVTLRAMVAENEEVWYEDGPPLTIKLCEDINQPDDISQNLNYNCQICDEAKYEVTFTGIWCRNTHPQQYPENDWTPKYSDLVGVSHSHSFVPWSPGSLASDGLKDLAEHTNSTQFEAEMREKVGDGVRTIIKGKGHGYPKMSYPTYAFFRVDKTNHLVSTAIALSPSPDWFLGITRFELCMEDNTWLQERELNLYPWDAGTDNGISYESPNDETVPRDAIARVRMSSYDKNSPFYEVDMKDIHPFGKLRIRLIRTYHRDCAELEDNGNEEEGGETDNTNTEEPAPDPGESEPSRYQTSDLTTGGDSGGSEEPEIDPDSSEECPLTQWEDWLPCSGNCVDGQMNGYQTRVRYHLVDGVPIEKYDDHVKPSLNKEVPKRCKDKYSSFEFRECTEDCTQSNEDITPSRQQNAIIPGQPWRSKKRNQPVL